MQEIINKIKQLEDLNFFKPWMMKFEQSKATSHIRKELIFSLLINPKDGSRRNFKYADAYKNYEDKAKAYHESVRKKCDLDTQLELECKNAFNEFKLNR